MLVIGLLWDAISVFIYSMVMSSSQLLVVRGLHAIGGSFVYPAFIARSREISGDRVGYDMGRLLTPIALAIALGTASAGFITYMLGYRIPFMALSVIILVAGLLALTLPVRPEERAWRGFRGVIEGVREAGYSAVAGLWLILTLYLALGVVVGGLPTSIVGIVVPREEEARLITGIGISLASLIAVVFFIINGVASDLWGIRVVLLYSILASTLGLIFAAATLKPYTILIGFSLFGIGLAGLMLISTILVTNVPAKARGTTVGLQQVFNIVGVAIGAPIGGILAGISPQNVLIAATIATLLALIAVIYRESRK